MHGGILDAGFQEADYVSGLQGPTAMEFARDGRLFIAEKRGTVRVVADGLLHETPFLTVAADTFWERGLGGITLDPNFETNGRLYIYYSQPGDPVANRLSRFTVSNTDPNVADPGSELVLLDGIPGARGLHNGGALHFGTDGKLYVGVGDAGESANAQSLSSLSGKILRLDPDAYPDIVPPDNPFVSNANARGEIWATGFRNPFTFAIHPDTGRILVNDVGEVTWEEIDDVVKGRNYGWPTCEGACNDPRFVDPIYALNHNGQDAALVGGAFYKGNQFPLEHDGDYFFGEFTDGYIDILEPTSNQTRRFASELGLVVDIDVAPAGKLYYLTISGSLHEISYVGGGNRAPQAAGSATPLYGAAPLLVTFSAEASSDPDNDPLTYGWDFGDGSPPGTGFSVSHQYVTNGTYQARLTVTDVEGATDRSEPIRVSVGNTPPQGTIRLSSAGAFFTAVYQDILGRDADSQGFDYWRQRLRSGADRSEVAAQLWGSAEHRARQVAGLYESFLGRSPAGGEENGWVGALLRGADETDVAAAFLDSSEYRANHATDEAFLAAAYQDVLGRAADAAGWQFWQDWLASGGSRGGVARTLLSSSERAGRVVDGYYQDFLDRSGGAEERRFWIERHEAGLDLEQIAIAFVGSYEYFALAAPRRFGDDLVSGYQAGDTVFFAGAAIDAEDVVLPPSAFQWEIAFHHQTHTHPFLGPVEDVESGAFQIPQRGETSPEVWYRVHLTVTDRGGLVHESHGDVSPRTSTVTVGTVPAGLPIAVDGQPAQAAPHTFTGVVGMTRTLSAPALADLGGATYAFESWSDRGAATHHIETPDADAAYTASFRLVPSDQRGTQYFVARLYEDLFGRGADPDGLAHWVGQLNGGLGRDGLAQVFWAVDEHRARQIEGYFNALLGRAVSGIEKAAWVNKFLGGASETEVMLDLLVSPEFYGQPNSFRNGRFVDMLYFKLLRRAPDAAGAADWVQKLDDGRSPRAVAAAFLAAEERLALVIEAAYQQILLRQATSAEKNAWSADLSLGRADERALAVGLLGSQEYFDLASR